MATFEVTSRTGVTAVVVAQQSTTFSVDGGLRGPTGPGLPTGGELGQVPVKKSNANQDFEFATIDKDYIGIPNVDNTSDLNKPISNAAQNALDTKAQIGGDLAGTIASPQVKARTVTAVVGATRGDYPVSSYANASAAIQAALTAVGLAGGGDVYILEGTYTIDVTLYVPPNVVVRGSRSKKTILIAKNSLNDDIFANANPLGTDSGIMIQDLVLDGDKTNNTSGRGIYFKNVSSSRIERVTIQRAAIEGILLESSSGIAVENSNIYYCGGSGLKLKTSNYCIFTKSDSIHNHVGVELSATSNYNQVTHNNISYSDLYSLLGGTAVDTGFNSYNNFSYNIIEHGGDDALVLDHNPFTTCIGNQVRYCGTHAGDQGLPIDTSANSVISGNIIEYNYADGIELKNSSNYCTITGNICRNNSNPAVGAPADSAGIVVRAGIIGCTITGNTAYCDEVTGSQRRGIILTGIGVDYNTVAGNIVYGNSVNQIELSSNIGTNNTVTDNTGSNATNTNVLISKIPDQPTKYTNTTTSNTIEIAQTGSTGTSRTKGSLFIDGSANSGVNFGMYSTYGAGALAALMQLRVGDTIANTTWDFNPAIALWTNVSQQGAFIIDQANSMLASRAGHLVKSSEAQTAGLGLIAAQMLNVSSTIPCYWADQTGTGVGYSSRNAGGTSFLGDQNGNGLGLDIDKDTTNTNSTAGAVRIVDTQNISDGSTYTKSGTALAITSNIASSGSGGTITDTSKVLTATQSNSGATGDLATFSNSGTGSDLVVNTNQFVLKAGKLALGAATTTPTAILDLGASTTSAASLRIRSGAAPTSPNSGDIWQDGTNMFARVGSTTYQLSQVATARNWNAGDQGLKGWSFDIVAAQATSILGSAGVLYLAKIPVGVDTTITNIHLDVTTAGASLTDSYVALYQDGSLLAQSADQSTTFQSTGTKTIALTGAPISVTAGFVYAAVWANGSTLPTFARGIGRSSDNVGLNSTNYRFATYSSSVTTTAPSTIGTLIASSLSYWMGVS